MKKNLLYLVILGFMLVFPVKAAVTVEESTDAEYLINAGYSQSFAEDVFVQKNRVLGKPIEPLYEKSQNKFVRACRKFYSYLDPSIENVDKIHHEIKLSPAVSDL